LADPKVREKYIDRVQAHAVADEIVQGKYWENGKGCAVGCTVQTGDSPHEAMETELGIPRELAWLEDTIFEGLSNGEAKAFPLRFLKAINTGADLSLITAKFMVWQFDDDKYGMKNIPEVKADTEMMGFCEEVVALYKRVIAGDPPTEAEFEDLYVRIDRASAGARARASAWARAWARAWASARASARARASASASAGARAWAWASARASASAWAWARASARAYDEKPYWSAMADKLIELLEETK
jgi:hypothetical protein